MALKKKERVLTRAEFIAKQKRDYAPFWINSTVLFGANLFPVEESFTKQITILFLLDVANYSTERAACMLQNWNEKYAKLHWESVFVFQQKYAFLKNTKFFERYKNQKVFLDTFGELFERFGSQTEPVAVILKNGELISSMPLLPNFPEMMYQLEQQLQKTLRADDHGLPLLAAEKCNKKNVAIEQSTATPEGVSTQGEWNGSKNILMTEKNNAIISLPFRGKFLRLIGMAHPNARDTIKVAVTLNEKPLSSIIRTPTIHEDSNTGVTTIDLNKDTGIYDLIQSEGEIAGIIKLTFLNAYDNGAVFYEFKIA